MQARNLIVIMSDEHDPRYMGVSGDAQIKTPNLDALAQRGTRFTNAVTPSPICVPARAAFATGRHVHEIGYWDNAIGYDGAERGWGHTLQDAGVVVESVGKLHYQNDEAPAGFDTEHLPMNLYNGHGMVWGSVRDPLPSQAPHGKRMLGEYIGPGESTYTRYDDAVTKRAEQWLVEHAADTSPWCLYVGLVAPHFPLVVPQAYLDHYPRDALAPRKLHPRDGHKRHPWIQRQHEFFPNEDQFESETERLLAISCYLGLCTWVDEHVGRIVDAIENTGLGADTRIIYTSDHGDNVGHRGMWGKSNFYLESVAVPMIMAGPDVAPAVVETPVSLIDLYPTILEAMDIASPGDEAPRPGRSLFELADGTTDTERCVFSQYHAVGTETGGFMVRKGRWKLHYYVDDPPELFDLEADPQELTDLGADPKHAAILAQMRAELEAICSPDEVNAAAKRSQAALIEKHGGREIALTVGAPAATPPPGTESA